LNSNVKTEKIMKVTTEQCSSLNISALQKAIRRTIDRDYPGSAGEELYAFTEKELKKFSVNNQFFEYSSMNNILGGHRWFFLCPQCKKRVGKLFLPPEGCLLERKYLCKDCHKIKNQSVIMGTNKIYMKVIRPLKKLQEIENKISKGYLPNDKIQILLNQHEAIENSLKASPEYRVYLFKKKHGLLKLS
jgi:uncharacterized protein YlaI